MPPETKTGKIQEIYSNSSGKVRSDDGTDEGDYVNDGIPGLQKFDEVAYKRIAAGPNGENVIRILENKLPG
mgnify:CR=1 FL=1